MKDLFQSEPPQSKFLNDYIAYYYFHDSEENGEIRSFIYYPHFKNALTIHKNASIILKDRYWTESKPNKGEKHYSFIYTKLISHAAKGQIHPPFHKIGVVFQPLGLNAFLSKNYCDFNLNQINVDFNYFNDTMPSVLDKVYSTENIGTKVRLLDEYFLSRFVEFDDKKMQLAIDLLIKGSAKYSVERLAAELLVSRKALYRMFIKHLNCPPRDYMKMVQFRKSIEIFQKEKHKSNLTELAHISDYYDQSNFIRHFKKVTGFNPKSFFKNLSTLGDQETYWTII